MAKLVSKTYAEALFELAVEEQKEDLLLKEILTVQTSLEENPELIQFLEHPEILKEEKIRVIENIFKGRVSDDVTGFLVVIVTKGRSKELPAIFAEFIAKVKEYKKIGNVQVTSAVELNEQWKERIKEKLLKTTGYRELEITYSVDPSLIGGMVIRLKDRVVDSSIKSKLQLLKDQLLKVSLDQEAE